MNRKHKASILGAGGKITGRMPSDTIKRVRVNRAGIAIDTRKGGMVVWFVSAPFRLMRLVA